jgi:putative transposase
MLKTIKFRIKDKNTSKELDLMAREVKFVWNICNNASRKKWNESRQYFHKFDPYFTSIFKGASKELNINSQTIQSVIEQFHKDIKQHKKQLRFKGRKSPKWIPFKGQTVKLKSDSVKYGDFNFRFWKTLNIKGKIKTGSFNCDSLGRWFVNLTYQAELKQSSGIGEVGIDLGLRTTASCSNGKTLKLKELDWIDRKVAKEQRARNFERVKALHIKKANIRKDKINKFALDLVRTNNLIAIGNISGFTKGNFAKSRYQNSWSIFKNRLEFKCLEYGVSFKEVPEHFTTQTCNSCGSIEGPKGIKGLSVSDWICSCGAGLNRDINAGINILSRAKFLAS